MNRKTNRNKDTKRMPGEPSVSAAFGTARHALPPPIPATDVPHPLADLPPEVVGSGRIRDKNRTGESFAQDVGTKAGGVSVPHVTKRQSGAAKKSAARR
jgi:hypothetical protein